MEGFKIIVDDINMIVKLISVNDYIDPITTENDLLKFFTQHNIIKGVNRNEILRAFVELYSLESTTEYVIAKGEKPKDGVDGKIVFKVDMSDKAKYFAPESDEDNSSIDFKTATGVPFVKENECLCEILPPTEGCDGFDAHGHSLPAKDGKAASITLGEGVRFKDKGTKVIAEFEGKPIFKDGKLYIDSVYEVRGDVCFETGNINFNGHVIVRGSVLDDFSVDAKSLEVKGHICNSFIVCEEDIVIYGGINGRNSESMNAGHISCGGNLLSKYVNDACIEAKGDVRVSKEIVNSSVQAFGKIYAHRIIGGATTALKGIEADIIGSEIGTPTIIEPGINYKVKYFDEALVNLTWQIESIVLPIKKFLGDNDYYKRLTTHNQKRLTTDYEQLDDICDGYLEIIEKKEKLINDSTLSPSLEAIVLKKLYTDVLVTTSTCHKKFMYEFDGPIILKENLPQKSILILNYTSDIKHEIEEEDFFDNPELDQPAPSKTVDKIKLPGSNKIIYTKHGISKLLKRFYQTIHGQTFIVYVFEDRNFKRLSLINELKRSGIKNVEGIKDEFQALEVIKENENTDKKMVIICNLHIGEREGLKFVSGVLHHQESSFGIFLAEKANKKLIESIKRIPSLAIFHESTDIKNITQKIKDFGLEF